jgi:hypothetical protein
MKFRSQTYREKSACNSEQARQNTNTIFPKNEISCHRHRRRHQPDKIVLPYRLRSARHIINENISHRNERLSHLKYGAVSGRIFSALPIREPSGWPVLIDERFTQ